MELAKRFGIELRIAQSTIRSFHDRRTDVHEFVDRSLMSEAAKNRYRKVFEDRLLALQSELEVSHRVDNAWDET